VIIVRATAVDVANGDVEEGGLNAGNVDGQHDQNLITDIRVHSRAEATAKTGKQDP
jgi:hypothetical protein